MATPDLNLLIILIPIIGTVIVNIIVAWRTSSKLDTVVTKVDAVNTQAEIIKGHVNSAATASTNKIDSLQNEIALLKLLLSDDKIKAALLAQTAAITQASNLTPQSKETK